MQRLIGAQQAGVPEGAMDQLGYTERQFPKEQEDPFPSDCWYFHISSFYSYTCSSSPEDRRAVVVSVSYLLRSADITCLQDMISSGKAFLKKIKLTLKLNFEPEDKTDKLI